MRKIFILSALLVCLTAWVAAQNNAPLNLTLSQLNTESVSDTTAVVAFSTNVASSTVVNYGADRNNLNMTAEAPWGSLTHRVTLSNLQPNTTYYWRVTTGQAQGTGQQTQSDIQSFTTKATGSTSQTYQGSGGLDISQMQVENVTGNSAIVAFSTNKASSTVVKYGTDQNNLDQTAEAPWGAKTHRVTLSNLKPNTTYYWQVTSGQAQGTGGGAMSAVQSFTTKPQ